MRDSRPRLVATDLDGTLLRSDLSISPFTRRVFSKVKEMDGATSRRRFGAWESNLP